MDLWIRSQDKKRLCLVEDLYIHDNIRYKEVKETEIIKDITGRYIENETIKQEIDEYINCEIWGNNHLLGTYNTQEQGLKVLDEVQYKICGNQAFVAATNSGIKPNNIAGYTYCGVYEMPEE